MSESVNEVEGGKESERDGGRIGDGYGRRGAEDREGRKHWSGEAERGGKGITRGTIAMTLSRNTRERTHILVITAHYHTYRALCQPVKGSAVAHDSGKTSKTRRFDPTGASIWLLHAAAKSMGGQGPVYRFASMSSVGEAWTPSPNKTLRPRSSLDRK